MVTIEGSSSGTIWTMVKACRLSAFCWNSYICEHSKKKLLLLSNAMMCKDLIVAMPQIDLVHDLYHFHTHV